MMLTICLKTTHKHFCLSVFILVILLNYPGVLLAQNDLNPSLSNTSRVEKAVFNKDLGTPSLIKMAPSAAVNKADAKAMIKELVGAGASTDFRKLYSEPTPYGVTTEKYQQYYNNVKVQHGVYSAVIVAGKAQAFTGEYYDLKNINTTPSINEAQALVFAKRSVNAKKYAWEQAKEARDNETNPLRKKLYNDEYEKLLPKGELVIVKDYDTKNVSDLAYRFNIYAGEPLSRAYVYVNAHTGKIMLYDKIIKHVRPDQKSDSKFSTIVPEVAFIMSGAADINAVNAPSAVGDTATVPILTRYAGTRLMGTTNVSGTANDPSGNGSTIVNSTNGGLPFVNENPWVLIDKRFHGVGSNQSEQTYDLNGVGGVPISLPAYGQARSFTDLDNNWTAAEHVRGGNNEGENDDFGFDAHWGAGIVYRYWNEIHGRKSFDNANSSIKSYIHSGVAYDNAFWNGSVMTYGDGSYQKGAQAGFAPLTSLDVCGHEVGHGVCSFTSDLVYANESGAMNEGFSDIWAAMVENYALQNIDSTLKASPSFPNGFEIWGIGEQIDARDTTGAAPPYGNRPTIDPLHKALRHMDTPGKARNPSSYAELTNSFNNTGERWTEQEGCTPNLANDQCGVHNNSGVLNRMMYVLVTGATGTTNTRNAINATAHGTQSVTHGEPYNVTGIGFSKAEKIMYLTELGLTPNAKFIEARNLAVLAAELLYGKCSFEWKQTILAWHSVAIGRSSDTAQCSSLQIFSAAVSRNSVNESVAKSSINCTDAVTNLIIAYSVLTPGVANAMTVTITPTGTATLGQDYTLTQTVSNYNANETGLKSVTLSIYNDAEVEGTTPETIVLAIQATDGMGFTKDTTITVTITDDDLVPVISNTRTNLLTEYFEGTAGNALPAGWSMVDRLGASTIKWITGTNASGNGFPTKAAYVIIKSLNDALDATALPGYDQAAGGEVMLTTPQIAATGKSDIRVKFTFAAMGETALDPNAPETTLDFGELLYSFDGVTFERFQGEANRQYRFRNTATKDSVTLPANFNGRTFKLGFNWYNDANVAAPPAFIIDSVEVSGGGQQVETELNHGVSEKHFANKEIYYTSAQDGQVLTRIANNTADLGCVNVTVTEAGNGVSATPFDYNGSSYQRAKKVIQITPSSANTTANYEIRLYATTAELTGITPASVKIIKVKDGVALSGMIPSGDAEVITPVLGDFNADGYYSFSAAGLTGFSQFVLTAGGGTPITYIFTGNGNWTDAANWSGNKIPPTDLNSGEIIIDNAVGGVSLLNITQTISGSGKLTINSGKNLLVPGTLIRN